MRIVEVQESKNLEVKSKIGAIHVHKKIKLHQLITHKLFAFNFFQNLHL